MSFFEKGLLLYLVLIIASVMWQPQIILTDSSNHNVLEYFGVTNNSFDSNNNFIYNNNNTINEFANPKLASETSTGNDTKAGMFKRGFEFTSAFQFIIDGLGNVMGVVQVIFQVVFSPFIIFGHLVTDFNAPPLIILIFAIPLVWMMFIAIFMFIRGII